MQTLSFNRKLRAWSRICKTIKMPAWSFNNRLRTPLVLLGLAESLILFCSVYVAGYFVFGGIRECETAMGPLVPRAVGVSTVILAALISMGLYQFNHRILYRETLVRVVVAIAAGTMVLASFYYVIPSISMGREMLALTGLVSLLFLIVLRFGFFHTVDENVFRRRVLVFGSGRRAAEIDNLRRRADRRGFLIVGTISTSEDPQESANFDPSPANNNSIDALASELGADEIVVAVDDRRGTLPIRQLLDCKLRGVDVIDLVEFLERETGKIRTDLVSPGWLVFSPGFRVSRFNKIFKRLFDLIVSVVGLILALPIMLAVIAAIKIEDGLASTVFYSQNRVGLNGRAYLVLKFRSMYEDAEADGKAVWAEEGDERITRVGRFIRKSRLDELPQLVNVLSGKMSLVGPRPERPEFVNEFSESVPYYAERHIVKPGITGWAQLNYNYASSEEHAIEKLQYDLFYIKNQGIFLDLVILLQTVEVVLWGKGAR